ncbi:MAG: ACT domain-containing protein [Clostridia bacterium]|nr:ACT domain-containing protein [Clostridia bacterium]
MAITQLSVFLENQPGRLAQALRLISAAGVNIRAMSLADTKDFGILRIIVSDVEKTKEILKNESVVIETGVIAVRMEDQAGALYNILQVLEEADINVEYLYAFTGRKDASAYVVLRVNETELAEKALKEKNIHTLSNDEMISQL